MNWFKLIIILTISFNALHAQLQSYVYFNEAYESNPFLIPEPQESWVSTLEGGLQLNFSSLALSYNGSYTSFSNFEDRSYYWHQAAFFGSFARTNLGVYLNQRFNRSDYSVYNYNTITAYVNHSETINSVNLYLASNVSLNNYPEIQEIDNLEINGTVRLNKSFETRTTVIAGFSLHYKDYTSSYSYIDTLTRTSGSGSGGSQSSTMQTILQPVEVDAPSVSQMEYWMRLAQSLSQTTGLALQYRARNNIKGAVRYLPGLPYNYNQESEIFDDPMGYELQSIGADITQLLPGQLILKASTYLGKKNYTVQGIYTDSETFVEEVLRTDEYQTSHMSLQKNFNIHNTRLTIALWYRWINNKSNSYWYNYKNHYGSISLSLNI